MTPALLVTLLGISAALAWGISDFFAAKSAKAVGPILASALVNILGILVFVIVYVLFLHPNIEITKTAIVFAASSGVFLALGAVSFFIGLGAGPVSLVSPISSTYPLVTTLLALAVFHAHLTAREMVGIFLVVLGITAASGLLSLQKSKRKVTKGPAFALLAALGWGIGFALLAQAINRADWKIVSIVEFALVTVTFLILVPLIKGDEVISRSTIYKGLRNKFVIGASIIQLLGVLALNVGISKSAATGGAVIIAISAVYPVLTIFLALKHFNERVKFIPLLGAFLGIAGVVVLSLG